jgi:hypothetical protein
VVKIPLIANLQTVFTDNFVKPQKIKKSSAPNAKETSYSPTSRPTPADIKHPLLTQCIDCKGEMPFVDDLAI